MMSACCDSIVTALQSIELTKHTAQLFEKRKRILPLGYDFFPSGLQRRSFFLRVKKRTKCCILLSVFGSRVSFRVWFQKLDAFNLDGRVDLTKLDSDQVAIALFGILAISMSILVR